MPVRTTYCPFFDGHLDAPDTQELARRLEELGLPPRWRDWAGLCAPLLNLFCIRHQEDGDLSHLPPERIAAICRWPVRKKSAEFVEALKACGFLDMLTDGRLMVHNFGHYNRRLLDDRARKRRGSSTEVPRKVHGTFHGNSAAKLNLNLNKTSGNGRSEKAPDIAIGETECETAGASRPLSEKQTGRAVNEKAVLAQPDDNACVEPLAAHVAPDPEPTRDDETQFRLSTFCACLRELNWSEEHTRRLARWLIGYQQGQWIFTAITSEWQHLVARCVYVTDRDRSKGVRDPVGFVIHLHEKSWCTTESIWSYAVHLWSNAEDHGVEFVEQPTWMVELLAGICRKPDFPKAPRSAADVQRVLEGHA